MLIVDRVKAQQNNKIPILTCRRGSTKSQNIQTIKNNQKEFIIDSYIKAIVRNIEEARIPINLACYQELQEFDSEYYAR